MSTEATRAVLSQAFADLFAAQYPAVPLSFENRKFSQQAQEPFVDFNIVQTGRERKNIGTNRFVRTKSMVVIEIYVPEDSGTKTLYEMSDYIGENLEEGHFPVSGKQNITTLTHTQQHDGKEHGFYRQTVMVPFWFDSAFES